MVPDPSQTFLGLEYFCNEGDELWQTSDADLIKLGTQELETMGLARAADVLGGTVIRQLKTYPVYTGEYKEYLERIRGFLDSIPNLQTVGRNGLHMYNNQDHSMLTAMLAVKNLLGERARRVVGQRRAGVSRRSAPAGRGGMMRKVGRLISAQRLSRLLLVVYVLLAGLYSVVTPLYEAPDETAHFDYIVQLRTTGRLPLQRVGYLGQAHQPPLYYVIGALASLPADITRAEGAFKPNPKFMWARPGGNGLNAGLHVTADTFPYTGQALAIHLVRAASVLMGAATIGLALAIGRRLLPQRPDLYLAAVALLVVNPQFLFISGAINNDNLLTLAATGIWWQTLRTLDRPEQRRQWLYLGGWISAAALAKFNGLSYGVLAGLFLVIMLARRRAWRSLLLGGLTTSIVVLALSGWWFVRNQALYGDPLGWQVYQTVGFKDVRNMPLSLTDPPAFFAAQIGTFDDFLRSFVGRFGWLNVKMPRWFYDGARLCLAAALAGLLVTASVTIRRRALQIQRPALMLIGLVVAGQADLFDECDRGVLGGLLARPLLVSDCRAARVVDRHRPAGLAAAPRNAVDRRGPDRLDDGRGRLDTAGRDCSRVSVAAFAQDRAVGRVTPHRFCLRAADCAKRLRLANGEGFRSGARHALLAGASTPRF